MSSRLIILSNINFSYDGKNYVLKNVSFAVPKGSIVGMLGPNGAGKTTILFILLGLLKPKKGYVKVFDLDPSEEETLLKMKIGFVAERPIFYKHLTMRQNLFLAGKLYNLEENLIQERIEHLSRILNLSKYLDVRPNVLSHGYRQRFAIAEALIADPELLVLDEPTTGLDPESMIVLRNFLIELNLRYNKTILISSHNLHLLEKAARYFIFIKDGIVVGEGWREDLLRAYNLQKSYIEIKAEGLTEEIKKNIGTRYDVVKWKNKNNFVVRLPSQDINVFLGFLLENGVTIRSIREVGGGLEELYLKICGERY